MSVEVFYFFFLADANLRYCKLTEIVNFLCQYEINKSGVKAQSYAILEMYGLICQNYTEKHTYYTDN